MSKQFALQQPGRNSSTVNLNEYAVLATAMFVNSGGHLFLPRSWRAEQQNGSISGRNGFDQLQDLLKRQTAPHNLPEIHVAADLLFEIKILLGQSLFEFAKLAVCERLLNGNGYLPGSLPYEVDFLWREGIVARPSNRQNSDSSALIHERYHTLTLHTLSDEQLVVVGRKLVGLGYGSNDWFEFFKGFPGDAHRLNEHLFLNKAFSFREIQCVHAKQCGVCFRERDVYRVRVRQFTNGGCNGAQHLAKV